MTAIARPSTPFPHTHTLTHSTSGSSYHRLSYGFPIHFAPKQVPTPTPPSLLARTSSSGSSSSGRIHLRRSSNGHLETPTWPAVDLPSTPSLDPTSPRRSSCASLPLTPPLESAPLDMEPAPLSLPPPQHKSSGFAMPPPSYNWSDKQIEASTSFDFSPPDEDVWVAAPRSSAKRPALERRDTPRPPQSPSRPSLKRRVTPRYGQTTLSQLQMVSPEDEARGDAKRRTLRSAIDGGKWIVMEE